MFEIGMLPLAGTIVIVVWACAVATRQWRRARHGGHPGDGGVVASDSHSACGGDAGCGGDGGGGD